MKTNRLLLAAALFLMSACNTAFGGTSELVSTESKAADFYGLVVNANANVILSQGETCSVKVEGDRRAVAEVSTRVENGALVINGDNTRPVNVYVTVGEINLVEVNGNAKVYANQIIDSDLLLLKVNGNGSIKMEVRSLSLGMIVKGNGRIVASGSTGDSFVRVYGNGSVSARNLDAFRQMEEVYNANLIYKKETGNGSKRLTLSLHD
jgi:uncharacterized protein YpmS